jgi:hypothetical protein
MSVESYYEPFFVQELKELPSPGADVQLYEYQDGTEVMGLFKQKQSGEVPIADTLGIETRGKFAAGVEIISGSILRRAKDGVLIKVIGDPLVSPPQALTQIRTWDSYVTSRAIEQAIEQQQELPP